MPALNTIQTLPKRRIICPPVNKREDTVNNIKREMEKQHDPRR